MKKMLTILAVSVIAAATQAATIEWDSGILNTPDGQANAKDRIVTASLFLIDKATYDAIDLSTDAGQQKVLADYLEATADATGTSKKTGLANVTTTPAGTGVANAQYAVIIYSYGEQYKLAKGYDFINELDKQEGFASELGSQTAWVTKSSSTPDPVPEPTTVALLALGLAAAGLKRKVA